jgi:hypothetical protein
VRFEFNFSKINKFKKNIFFIKFIRKMDKFVDSLIYTKSTDLLIEAEKKWFENKVPFIINYLMKLLFIYLLKILIYFFIA